MSVNSFMMDALAGGQNAQAFLLSQLTYIEREVYRIRYPAIRYHLLVPVDTSAPEWIPSVTYFSMDGAGKMDWFNGQAKDVPKAEVIRGRSETTVKMSAIGYAFGLEELAQAQMLGHNLTTDKASYARLAAEEFVDQAALFGDAGAGFSGLCNNATVTIAQAALVGTNNGVTAGSAASSMFYNKTPAQILNDVNGMLNGIWITTLTVELADTLLLPLGAFQYLATTPFNSFSEKTLLSWLRDNNAYTSQSGRPLGIFPVRGLDTAGVGGTARAVAYWKDPQVVKMHMPMPFRFVGTPMQTRPLYWEVPGIMRFGGVDVRRPGAFRYLDGV